MIKKVAAIHDLSGIGRCSLNVAILILSVMKLQVCPVPTAILSNQTGFETFSLLDFTPYMEDYIAHWKSIGYTFNCIYSGFLGSAQQIEQVIAFIKYFKNPDTLTVIDPVMGDDGQLYAIYDEDYKVHMRKLITYADVITPNYTEFLMLIDQQEVGSSVKEIYKAAEAIKALGLKKMVITGVIKGDKISNIAIDFELGEIVEESMPYNHKSYSGTGDLFASILSGFMLNGYTLQEATKKATQFISKTINYTQVQGLKETEGILFEHYLGELMIK